MFKAYLVLISFLLCSMAYAVSGPYAGFGVGLGLLDNQLKAAYVDQGAISIPVDSHDAGLGAVISGTLGYQYDWENNNYLGFEFQGGYKTTKASGTITTSNGTSKFGWDHKSDASVFLSLVPGFALSEMTSFFVNAGYGVGHFQDDYHVNGVLATHKKWLRGEQVGVGVNSHLTYNLSIRTSVLYQIYASWGHEALPGAEVTTRPHAALFNVELLIN